MKAKLDKYFAYTAKFCLDNLDINKLVRGMPFFTLSEKVKNGQATFIAPLQPSTLASFPPWGSSKGADRKRLARHKSSNSYQFTKLNGVNISCFFAING